MAAKEHDLVLFCQRRKLGEPTKRSLPLPTSAYWRCLGPQDTHLSHIQQVDLQEEPQGTACQLVRGPSNCITKLVANGQLLLLLWFLLGREGKTENMLRILVSNLEGARSTQPFLQPTGPGGTAPPWEIPLPLPQRKLPLNADSPTHLQTLIKIVTLHL